MSIRKKVGLEFVVGKDGTKGWISAVYRTRVLVMDNVVGIASALNDWPPDTWRSVKANSIMDTASKKKFMRVFHWGIAPWTKPPENCDQ